MLIIDQIFPVGTVTKAHAFAGQLKVILRSGLKILDKPKGTVFLMIRKKAVPFFIEEVNISSETSFVLKLEDINSIEDAKNLCGSELYLHDSQKSVFDQDVIHAAFFQGYTLHNQDSKLIGRITAVIDNTTQYLLEIDNKLLVPFHEDLVISIDNNHKVIRIQLAEGLIDSQNIS